MKPAVTAVHWDGQGFTVTPDVYLKVMQLPADKKETLSLELDKWNLSTSNQLDNEWGRTTAALRLITILRKYGIEEEA